jgi:small basic protein (TIGR04137 family)
MSMDKSLKTRAALERHRNVLTRAERIEALKEQGKWREDDSPIGLPKVAHRKAAAGGKSKQTATPTEAGETEGGEEPKES